MDSLRDLLLLNARSRYEIKRSNDDRYYFVLIANNNEIIATSQMYTTKQSAKNGIESVKQHADSEIKDLTE